MVVPVIGAVAVAFGLTSLYKYGKLSATEQYNMNSDWWHGLKQIALRQANVDLSNLDNFVGTMSFYMTKNWKEVEDWIDRVEDKSQELYSQKFDLLSSPQRKTVVKAVSGMEA